MKKLFAIMLTVVLMMTATVSVFAAPGQFVKSPSKNAAPTLISFEKGNEDCTAKLIVTPYKDRNTLPAELKTLIEKAYDDIVKADDLTTLNKDLSAVAAKLKLAGTDLKVSDLFDIRYEGCDDHDETHTFDIVLGADTLHRFVGLLHMDKNGEWELIQNAKVVNNGEALSFTVSDLSPFAIVVDTGTPSDSPQTGVVYNIAIYGTLMLVSAMAIVVLVVKSKKYA